MRMRMRMRMMMMMIFIILDGYFDVYGLWMLFG
jgi:hypothetical protein